MSPNEGNEGIYSAFAQNQFYCLLSQTVHLLAQVERKSREFMVQT